MLILAHRGWWKTPDEKNTIVAFKRALQAGFGLELDLRDHNGGVVISHDPPIGSALPLSELLALYDDTGRPGPLALNIKSDGLQRLLEEPLSALRPSDFFLFDMSIPDTLGYLKRGLRVFTRQSEYEPTIAFPSQVGGVWLDIFEGEWHSTELVSDHLSHGRQVALVSPELHGRAYQGAWIKWRDLPHRGVMLCTDYPKEAQDFYNEN